MSHKIGTLARILIRQIRALRGCHQTRHNVRLHLVQKKRKWASFPILSFFTLPPFSTCRLHICTNMQGRLLSSSPSQNASSSTHPWHSHMSPYRPRHSTHTSGNIVHSGSETYCNALHKRRGNAFAILENVGISECKKPQRTKPAISVLAFICFDSKTVSITKHLILWPSVMAFHCVVLHFSLGQTNNTRVFVKAIRLELPSDDFSSATD